MILSIRAGLSTQNIDGELVILDKDNGQIHQLNGVASFVWQRIEDGLTVSTISEHLVERYEIDNLTAESDIDKVVQQFQELKLLN